LSFSHPQAPEQDPSECGSRQTKPNNHGHSLQYRPRPSRRTI
jgi:hypothetical protein